MSLRRAGHTSSLTSFLPCVVVNDSLSNTFGQLFTVVPFQRPRYSHRLSSKTGVPPNPDLKWNAIGWESSSDSWSSPRRGPPTSLRCTVPPQYHLNVSVTYCPYPAPVVPQCSVVCRVHVCETLHSPRASPSPGSHGPERQMSTHSPVYTVR